MTSLLSRSLQESSVDVRGLQPHRAKRLTAALNVVTHRRPRILSPKIASRQNCHEDKISIKQTHGPLAPTNLDHHPHLRPDVPRLPAARLACLCLGPRPTLLT